MPDITIHETDESRKSRDDAHDAAYEMRIDDAPFLFLYTTTAAYVLAWDGRFAQDNLHRELLSNAARAALDGQFFLPFIIRWKLDATFQTTHGLIKQTIPYAAWLGAQRSDILPPADEIMFARYDITRGEQLLYGATAANPRYGDTELAIEQPRSVPVSEKLLEWMLSHHQDQTIALRINRDEARDELNRAIIESYPKA